MLKTRSIRSMSAALAVAGALMALSSAAVHAEPLPPILTQGGISFVSGGVGDDEVRAFEAEQARWPVMLEFAVKDTPVNSYLASVQVQIRNAAGREILSTVSEGPFMLVRLDPGHYQVAAQVGGKTIETALNVKADKPVKEVFMWPNAFLRTEG